MTRTHPDPPWTLVKDRHFAARQWLGERDNQEDDFGFYLPEATPGAGESTVLAVLADGMGGAAGGEVASALAVEHFLAAFASSSGSVPESLMIGLEAAIQGLAAAIHQYPDLAGMGCTLVAAACTVEPAIYWISVGDSPLWLLRQKRLIRLNADHSVGGLDRETLGHEARPMEDRDRISNQHMLVSALTDQPPERVDGPRGPFPLLPSDRLLLASDGLLTLSEREILAHAAKGESAAAVAAGLVAVVREKGVPGQDNTTVLALLPWFGEASPAFFGRLRRVWRG